MIDEAPWAAMHRDDWTASAVSNIAATYIDLSFSTSEVVAQPTGTSIVPCPPPMPTPEDLSPVNTSPSSPNSVQSVDSPEEGESVADSPEAEQAEEANDENEGDVDGNYSESEEKPRKRRGRKRKLGTDDPEELKAIHNLNEKKRRADQRRLFAQLRKVVPGVEEQAQKTIVLQRVYEYIKQQEHTIEVQRKKLTQYESQLGIPHDRTVQSSPKGTASARAARGARRASTASEA